ncbi:hypothetical protein T492DRAFT_936335 [Pavlovales sp. CCMP2436]|nr:hypothetical protein T492DRAFT_936335 [Pavlovales sp. CCMP2436]
MAWTCALCTFDFNEGASCRMCGTPQPDEVGARDATAKVLSFPEPELEPAPAPAPAPTDASNAALQTAAGSAQAAAHAEVGASPARLEPAPRQPEPRPATECLAAERPAAAAPSDGLADKEGTPRAVADVGPHAADSAELRPAAAEPAPRARAKTVAATVAPLGCAVASAKRPRSKEQPPPLLRQILKIIAVDDSSCKGATDALHAAAQAIPNGGFARGGAVMALSSPVTHLVREDHASVTLLTYFALARGLRVVTPEFVFESLEKGSWLPEADFACNAIGPAALGSAEKHRSGWAGALAGRSVCFHGCTHLPRATLAALVRCAGGSVEKSHRLADVLISDAETGATRAWPVQPSKYLFDEIVRAATEPLEMRHTQPESRSPGGDSLAAGATTPKPQTAQCRSAAKTRLASGGGAAQKRSRGHGAGGSVSDADADVVSDEF